VVVLLEDPPRSIYAGGGGGGEKEKGAASPHGDNSAAAKFRRGRARVPFVRIRQRRLADSRGIITRDELSAFAR